MVMGGLAAIPAAGLGPKISDFLVWKLARVPPHDSYLLFSVCQGIAYPSPPLKLYPPNKPHNLPPVPRAKVSKILAYMIPKSDLKIHVHSCMILRRVPFILRRTIFILGLNGCCGYH